MSDNTAPIPTPTAAPDLKEAGSLRERVQKEVVKVITKGLESGSISEDRARGIAKMILEKVPDGISDKELIEVVPTLDDEFAELGEVVIPIVVEYEEKVRKIIEGKVLNLVRARKFEDAIDMARKGMDYSKQLAK
jgi:hypothetical protein